MVPFYSHVPHLMSVAVTIWANLQTAQHPPGSNKQAERTVFCSVGFHPAQDPCGIFFFFLSFVSFSLHVSRPCKQILVPIKPLSFESYCKGTDPSGLEIYSTWSCALDELSFLICHILKADFLPGLNVLLSIMVFSTESVTALSSMLWNHEIKHLSRRLPFKTVKSKLEVSHLLLFSLLPLYICQRQYFVISSSKIFASWDSS